MIFPRWNQWSERMMADKDRKIAEELKKRLLGGDGERIHGVLLYGSRAKVERLRKVILTFRRPGDGAMGSVIN
jgi:hypothetical protein